MNLSKGIDFLKLKFTHRITVFLILLLFTILPSETKIQLGIDKIYQNYRSYISLGLLIFFVLVIVGFGEEITRLIKPRIAALKLMKLIKYKLNNLTELEKEICKEAMYNDGMITFDISSGVTLVLEHYFVMNRALKY
jgi:hypothetical protein